MTIATLLLRTAWVPFLLKDLDFFSEKFGDVGVGFMPEAKAQEIRRKSAEFWLVLATKEKKDDLFEWVLTQICFCESAVCSPERNLFRAVFFVVSSVFCALFTAWSVFQIWEAWGEWARSVSVFSLLFGVLVLASSFSASFTVFSIAVCVYQKTSARMKHAPFYVARAAVKIRALSCSEVPCVALDLYTGSLTVGWFIDVQKKACWLYLFASIVWTTIFVFLCG